MCYHWATEVVLLLKLGRNEVVCGIILLNSYKIRNSLIKAFLILLTTRGIVEHKMPRGLIFACIITLFFLLHTNNDYNDHVH
jgi:hypothetical protein